MEFKNQTICPRSEIIPYLDGELSHADEDLLEFHLKECKTCQSELNEQKKLLSVMNFAFTEKEDFALPKDFAKVVAVRAESNVSGLRCHKERKIAFYSSFVLLSLCLVGFGGNLSTYSQPLKKIAEPIFGFVSFIFYFVFDFFVGFTAIIKIISLKFVESDTSLFLTFIILFISLFGLYFFTRKRNFIETDNV
jgi:hypothetical protein